MKYLDYPILNELSSSLSSEATSDLRVHVRFEAYSVKSVGKEKRAFKEREAAYVSEQESMEEMSFSPEMREAGLSSCFGRLDEKESRKAHFLLVSTLNSAFPDHDFSSLRPDHFTREISALQVLANVQGSLPSLTGNSANPPWAGGVAKLGPTPHSPQSFPLRHTIPPLLSRSHNSSPPTAMPFTHGNRHTTMSLPKPDLYRVLNEVIPLDDCEVYSWFPEPEYDPHVEGYGIYEEDGPNQAHEVGVSKSPEPVDGKEFFNENGDWGETGMDLENMEMETEDVREGGTMFPERSLLANSHEDASNFVFMEHDIVPETVSKTQVDGLLWSANYFFYSRWVFLLCVSGLQIKMLKLNMA
ncbi:hypothetical protein IAT38_006132 [Cryptococcus sp. DSM 104549]